MYFLEKLWNFAWSEEECGELEKFASFLCIAHARTWFITISEILVFKAKSFFSWTWIQFWVKQNAKDLAGDQMHLIFSLTASYPWWTHVHTFLQKKPFFRFYAPREGNDVVCGVPQLEQKFYKSDWKICVFVFFLAVVRCSSNFVLVISDVTFSSFWLLIFLDFKTLFLPSLCCNYWPFIGKFPH